MSKEKEERNIVDDALNDHYKDIANDFIDNVSQQSELVCDKPSPVKCAKWQRFENGCLDCNMVRDQICG